MACHVLQTYYGNADVDLYISSGIRDYAQLVQNTRQIGLFREVHANMIHKTFCKGHKLAEKFSYAFRRTSEIVKTL